MFVDASALVALLSDEAEATRISDAIAANQGTFTSALAILETALALARPDKWNRPIGEIEPMIMGYLGDFGVALREIPDGQQAARHSLDAAARFRSGRRGLNLADCMHYASAKYFSVPILATANEFRQTDLDVVP